MYPRAFEYFDPLSLADAHQLLNKYKEDARLMAGGQSLIPLMKLRLTSPKVIIDLGRIKELSFIAESKDRKRIEIGALATHYQLESSELLKKYCPMLTEAASVIGDPHIRNKGTIGGSVVHADPAADFPPCLLALDAELMVSEGVRTRKIRTREFFVDYFETIMRPSEILRQISVPVLGSSEGSAYLKLSRRGTDFAIVGAAAYLKLGGSKSVEKCAVALSGVEKRPVRAKHVEDALCNQENVNSEIIEKASELVAKDINPSSDVHASRKYREKVARVYVKRSLELALKRASA